MPEIKKFPKGFLWGAATSAYQVEGGIENNDWARDPLIAKAGPACDHYHRYVDDFLIAKGLNHNAHRLSLEWSRIEPEKGRWNEQELRHYHHVLSFLKENGFVTFVTLHHFTNPLWFAKEGGWLNKNSTKYFEAFTSKIAQSLGHLIDFWITINEPNVYADMCYRAGIWPPHKRSLLKTYRVYRNMLEAHNRVYEIIHKYYPKTQAGFAQNIAFNEVDGWPNFSMWDVYAVRFIDWMTIGFTYQRTKNDFVGLNHYFHKVFSLSKSKVVNREGKAINRTDKGWEIYPLAIYKVLLKLKKLDLPIYITENGIADSQDLKRADYIHDYLEQVYFAIRHGVDVKGYLYWSLLDNYEWPVKSGDTGYGYKFGLVEVDFNSKALTRRVRESAKVYARICKENGL